MFGIIFKDILIFYLLLDLFVVAGRYIFLEMKFQAYLIYSLSVSLYIAKSNVLCLKRPFPPSGDVAVENHCDIINYFSCYFMLL